MQAEAAAAPGDAEPAEAAADGPSSEDGGADADARKTGGGGGLGANLVSTVRSFLPFVSKPADAAAPPAAGKKTVKVRIASSPPAVSLLLDAPCVQARTHQGTLRCCTSTLLHAHQKLHRASVREPSLQVKALEAADAARRKEAQRAAERAQQRQQLEAQKAERLRRAHDAKACSPHPLGHVYVIRYFYI